MLFHIRNKFAKIAIIKQSFPLKSFRNISPFHKMGRKESIDWNFVLYIFFFENTNVKLRELDLFDKSQEHTTSLRSTTSIAILILWEEITKIWDENCLVLWNKNLSNWRKSLSELKCRVAKSSLQSLIRNDTNLVLTFTFLLLFLLYPTPDDRCNTQKSCS